MREESSTIPSVNLGNKATLIIAATFIPLLSLFYFVTRQIVIGEHNDLEEQMLKQNVHRALNALEGEVSALETINQDWANWDDTYRFVEDRNEPYIHANLMDETFVLLKLNHIAYVNTSGVVVFEKAYAQAGHGDSTDEGHLDKHGRLKALAGMGGTNGPAKGVFLVEDGPMLLSILPILTSEKQGPARGALIMGRHLDADRIGQVSRAIDIPIALYRLDDPDLPLEFQDVRANLTWINRTFPQHEQPILCRVVEANVIAGYTLVKDLNNNPALAMRIFMPRDIYRSGASTMRYVLLALLGVGFVSGFVSIWLLQKIVIRRLMNLNHQVFQIGVMKDLSARLTIQGNDELSGVESQINRMLAAMEESSRGLSELSRHLQNVREEESARLARRIHDDLGQLLMALKIDACWIEKRLAPDRKDLGEKARSMAQMIDTIARTIQDISLELCPSVLEKLPLSDAIEWYVDDFRKRTRLPCALSIEPENLDFEIAFSTAVFRILQEALSNVARHAQATDVSVRVAVEDNQLKLTIRDNGKGIEPGQLSDLKSFGLIQMKERAGALQGKARIESAPGQGTTVQVVLPAPTPAQDRSPR